MREIKFDELLVKYMDEVNVGLLIRKIYRSESRSYRVNTLDLMTQCNIVINELEVLNRMNSNLYLQKNIKFFLFMLNGENVFSKVLENVLF